MKVPPILGAQNAKYILLLISTWVVVVALTLTRIFIKSVVTGQAPVTLELSSTPGEKHKQPKVVHAYITTDATIHTSTRNT